MSQLFASPDESQAEPSPKGAVKVDDVSTAMPTPEAAAAVPPGPAPAPPREAADGIFGTPPVPQAGSIDYTVPPAPPGHSRPRRPRRGAFAGIAALALLLGTAGGVGGAAAWQQWGPSDAATAQVATLPVSQSTSTVQPASGSVAAVAKAALPSVVQIEVKTATGGDTGSGIIIRADGYILTNNHVISAASNGTIQVLFSDGQVSSAKVVGSTSAYDLAVIKVDRTGLTPLVLGDSSAMVVGDPVIAVGSPLGLDSTVTTGIVSALDRPVTTGDTASTSAYIAAIQTDAAINPGNSGGPLLNMSGEVIGINSAIAALPGATQATGAGSVGLGFAIPSNQARRVAEQLIADGKATVPAIGAQLDSTYTGRGVRVADSSQLPAGSPGVVPGSPAAKAGIVGGDIIVAMDGTPVADASSAIVRIRSHAPGDIMTFTLLRGGKDVDVKVTLGTLSSLDYGNTGTTGGTTSGGSQ
ncbi:S1C family serine protease [Demequina lutea]|uniref:Putative serine protease PepD n=1 Tax=Demequina lutea TaxID=431489 RepID=A0A7Z0CKU0_9MICO|nr:trypsin-like peptidase domain-containing protein [Demequina lutea]NYI42253.1 putative serine protease PepD [Demequina lutea]